MTNHDLEFWPHFERVWRTALWSNGKKTGRHLRGDIIAEVETQKD
jgi:hypothetical protein